MKRVICLLLSLLFLWGCGATEPTAETGEKAEETAALEEIVLVGAECFGEIPPLFQSEENLTLLRGAVFLEAGFLTAGLQGVQQFWDYNFQVQEMPELPKEDDYTTMGFHNGERIAYNDRIFEPTAADRLPEADDQNGVYLLPLGIFDWENGYIIARTYHMGSLESEEGAWGYAPGQCQLILTAYDANGAPVWQTVSEMFEE